MEQIRYIKSEFEKTKHSNILLLHIMLPIIGALLFTAYYSFSTWDTLAKISGYYYVISCAFPIGAAFIIGKNIGLEEESNFQRILGITSRIKIYFAKLNMYLIFALITSFISVAAFQIIYEKKINASFGMFMIFIFLVTNLIIYQIHLFLNLCFGKTISIMVAICGSIVGMLMLTGLGEGIWMFIPYGMAGRLCGYLTYQTPEMFNDMFRAIPVIFIILVVITVAVSVWFSKWEGRSVNE